jgi:DNA-binding transcriptional ArsR family regulator
MKTGPDIARIAALVGDPARANMLTALISGRALTATELAHDAGVTPQTASSHLAKLEQGGLIVPRKQGRHRYYQLSGEDVAPVLEGLMGLAARAGHFRSRIGPDESALRRARVCYDHLAGDRGVQLFDALTRRGFLATDGERIDVTPGGGRFFGDFRISLADLRNQRRPLCRACLDWSARRSHLAGGLGAALLQRFYELKWARRDAKSRAVIFSQRGNSDFDRMFAGAQAGR